MKCTEAKPLFSPYLDGAVTGVEMHELSDHLAQCSACRSEYDSIESTRQLLSSLGQKPAPADLSLRLRVAIAGARSRNWRDILSSYTVRVENAFNALLFPATAGLLSAIIFFAALIGFFVPAQVSADDVPTSFYTPPRLQMSELAQSQLSLDTFVVVETYVDETGSVQNYRIIAGPDDEQIREQLNRALLLTHFVPAQAFGRPVAGKAVISFSNIIVQG